jgi:hypothetical protein
MSNMDIMYRAYRGLQKAMAEAATYSEMTEALSRADNGKDMHGGTVALREIDMDWVEAIERAIPFIDEAIRDQRRFIVQEDEIVPIEKSRKITSESVRHLAQHTNMIAKVEGDTVTPERILNIYREESFAIYENRFLRTLLQNAGRFVEKRYEALCKVPGESAAQLEMSRVVQVRQEQVRVQFSYETEYEEENDVDIAADVSKLSKFQRVLRIRKIISNFMVTPLMRSLVGCEPVRPPIMRTNMLTQNANFRAALDLWVFLEGYTKNGYYTVLSKSDGPMAPMMKRSLYDVISLTRFVVRMNLSESIRRSLEEEYEAENARRAAEAARIEEERKAAEAKKLKMALAEQAQEYEERIAGLITEYEARLAEMEEIYLKQAEEMAASYEAQLAGQKADYESRILTLTGEYETQLSEQRSGYENQIATLTGDYETQLSEQRSGYENQIATLTGDYETQLSEQKTGYEEQIATLTMDYETQLSDRKISYEAQLQETAGGYEAQLDELRRSHREALDDMTGAHAAEIDRLKEQRVMEQEAMQKNLEKQMAEYTERQENAFQELAGRYAADAADARIAQETQLEEQRNAHAMEINAISSSYEMKIADQAVRHSREVQDLTRKNRKEREANVLVKRELKSLQAECRQLKHSNEQMKQQMARVEAQASRRINRAELWNDFRVRRLKNKLEKAVAGYPLDEVRKAGEELWTMTADPIFDADDTETGRFEYYRFEESPSEPSEEHIDSKAEESTV